MTKHFHLSPLLVIADIALFAFLAGSSATTQAGDMKVEEVGDLKLFHSRFGMTPFPNKTITIEPKGVRFSLSPATKNPQYTAIYSFFKIGGDFEISANYDWTPVVVPKGGYGVSCGIAIETNDKMHRVALARGNFPGEGGAYRVSTGIRMPDRSVVYKNEPLFKTKAKSGKLMLTRNKKEIICSAGDQAESPMELCRIPFTDAAVQSVFLFADPGAAPTELKARLTQLKIRAEETSHHMTKNELPTPWFGLIWAVGAVLLAGTIGYVVIRRIRTGQWGTSG
jgi:hypothetical protein